MKITSGVSFDLLKREPLLTENQYVGSLEFKKENYIDVTFESALDTEESDITHRERVSWLWCYKTLEYFIQRYSGGDAVGSIEEHAELAIIRIEKHKSEFPDFSLDLTERDAYQYLLWLLSIGVLFGFNDRIGVISSWIGNASNDVHDSLVRQLFSRMGIALSGDVLLHSKPYAELQAALGTHGDEQQQLMGRYLKHWYRNMKGCYWYERDKRPAAGFFGYWAFEAGMVTVLWDIDDTVYRDLPYYPKDLVDYARAKHVADNFPQGRLTGAPGMTAKSGEECPCTGVWTCDDWAVGPQTFSRGITLPTDSGRPVTWRLTKVI